MNKAIVFCLALAATGAAAAADFTYTQRTEVTGGSIKQMMGMLGRLAKGINEPQTSTVYLSGGQMATHAGESITVMDANAGAITNIDTKRKEYSVITFQEMIDAMNKMGEKMKGSSQDASAKAALKVTIEDKGAGREIAGVATHNMLMKIISETTVTDKKSGQQAVIASTVDNDMLIGKAPGSEAFREFAQLMQGRFPLQQVPFQAMMQGGIDVDGLREAGKKMAELDGMPLHSVMRIANAGDPNAPPMPPQQSRGQQPELTGTSVGQEVSETAAESAAESVAGRIGRFGGFGGLARRKVREAGSKPRSSPAPAPASEPAPAPAQAQAPGANVLIELTSEVISFNSGAVNPSVFAVPLGFKEVESPMKKMAR